jgi:hypothetical protein
MSTSSSDFLDLPSIVLVSNHWDSHGNNVYVYKMYFLTFICVYLSFIKPYTKDFDVVTDVP